MTQIQIRCVYHKKGILKTACLLQLNSVHHKKATCTLLVFSIGIATLPGPMTLQWLDAIPSQTLDSHAMHGRADVLPRVLVLATSRSRRLDSLPSHASTLGLMVAQ